METTEIRKKRKKKTSTYETPFRRRRQEKTNYKKRLALLRSGKPRLVVRRSTNQVVCQVVSYERQGDRVIATAHSKDLKGFGWELHNGNLPAAYLTGRLCGLKAVKEKVGQAILDIGLNTPIHGSVVFAALKGAIDAGIQIPCNQDVFPKEDRINGKHIADYASTLKDDELKRRFSGYLKKGLDPKKTVEYFNKTLGEIKNKYGESNG